LRQRDRAPSRLDQGWGPLDRRRAQTGPADAGADYRRGPQVLGVPDRQGPAPAVGRRPGMGPQPGGSLRPQPARRRGPQARAARRALIGRVYFDLVGLPPTPAEVEAFVADSAPDAYEKLVDRLLASPCYGEQQARHWLDLVRYAESDGFRLDSYRPNAWRYRD